MFSIQRASARSLRGRRGGTARSPYNATARVRMDAVGLEVLRVALLGVEGVVERVARAR